MQRYLCLYLNASNLNTIEMILTFMLHSYVYLRYCIFVNVCCVVVLFLASLFAVCGFV